MIPMKKESKTICFNDFTQAVPYSNDTAVGLFVTSLERNGDGESLGVLIVIVQLAPAGFHAMLDDIPLPVSPTMENKSALRKGSLSKSITCSPSSEARLYMITFNNFIHCLLPCEPLPQPVWQVPPAHRAFRSGTCSDNSF